MPGTRAPVLPLLTVMLALTAAPAVAQPVARTAVLPVVADGAPTAALVRDQPSVDMAADGRFAVAYTEEAAGALTVWVQRFAADGGAVGARVPVDTVAENLQAPAIAMSADGRFVVAYERRTLDGTEQHVELRRFDADGTPQGPAVAAGPLASVDESAPDVGLADDGSVAVTWRNLEDVAGTPTWRLRYRAFAPGGAPRSAERDASPEDLFDRAQPSLAMAPDGRFVITWERRFTFMTTREVPYRRFGADGEPAGAASSAFSGATGGASGNSRPAAGIRPSGASALVWEGATDQFDAGLSAQLLTPDGTADGAAFPADEQTAKGLSPSLALDDDGTLFAGYECYTCPQQVATLREFAPDGTPRGAGVVVGDAITDGRIFPEVATNGSGEVVIAWAAEEAGGAIDAFARRYGATPKPVPPAATPTPAPVLPAPTPTPTPVTTPVPPPPALACTANRLVLTDVFPRAGRVQMLGAAPSGSAGRKVTLVSSWNRKTVATATVGEDLTFAASAPLPPRSIRATNAARYVARFDGRTSAALKFARRMYTTQLRVGSGGRITFAGTVTRPLAAPPQPVTIVAAGSCAGLARGTVVAKVRPSRRGTFSATFAVPASLSQAPVVFLRAQTRVRTTTRSRRTSATFTLVRSVRGR